MKLSVRLALMKVTSLFYYSVYFFNYLWALLYYLILFICPIALFQLTFTFIYSTFSKKFLVSAKEAQSVLLNFLFRNLLRPIKYQAREAQPELSTPIMSTNFLHGSYQES